MSLIYDLPTQIPIQIDGMNISEYLESIGSSCDADDNIPSTEMFALQSLYNATNGMHWNHWDRPGQIRPKQRWNFTGFEGIGDKYYPNPCNQSWQGVSCLRNQSLAGGGRGCTVIALYTAYMNLTGTIPSTVHYLSQLMFFEINFNSVHGSLPLEIFSLTNLLYINTYKNAMTGTVPPELGQLSSLMFIGFMENKYSGTIPTEIGLLTNLWEIYIYANSFSGPIPSSIANCKNLSTLDLYYNYLSGPIPASFESLYRLFNFEVTSNLLTGPFPTYIGSTLLQIKYLEFSENFLTGTLGSQLGNLWQVNELAVGVNYFSGTVFNTVGKLKTLETFSLSTNFFSSTLPNSFPDAIQLKNLLLDGNMLVGNLNDLFSNTSSLPLLGVLDISDNGFTGSIPTYLLSGKFRTSVAMVKNCFEGSLSADICSRSPLLQDLALDGLSAGDLCQRFTLQHVLSSYTSRLMTGCIPGCLYSLLSLQSLQLSGNGFTGTLPSCLDTDGINISALNTCVNPVSNNLSVLILSHNRLSGSIPTPFQTHHFNELDLSYNRLKGTASDLINFFSDSDIDSKLVLQVNRLSGDIPITFRNAINISVLDGNLFGCKNLNDLPVNDPSYESAQCGSYQLYEIFVIYGFLFLIAASTISYLVFWVRLPRKLAIDLSDATELDFKTDPIDSCKQKESKATANEMDINSSFSFSSNNFDVNSLESVQVSSAGTRSCSLCHKLTKLLMHWKSDWHVHKLVMMHNLPAKLKKVTPFYDRFSLLLNWVIMFCGCSIAVSTAVFLPTFVGLKYTDSKKFSSHTYDYGWFPSIAFLLGLAPGVLLSVEVIVAVIVLFYFLANLSRQMNSSAVPSTSASPATAAAPTSRSTTTTVTANGSSNNSIVWDWFAIRAKEALVVLFDMIVMITANSLFLFASFSLRRGQLIVIQVALVVFKINFNRTFLPILLTRIYSNTWNSDNVSLYSFKRTKGLTIQTAMIVFNNILAPCIAIFATDSTCFHNLLFNSSPVSSSFGYNVCVYVNGLTETCDIYQVRTVTTTFVPPFIYSYQCSSALLITYVPIFLIMYAYVGFVSPLLDYFRIYCCRFSALQDRPIMKKYVLLATPLLLKPIEYSLMYLAEEDHCHNRSTSEPRSVNSMSRVVESPIISNMDAIIVSESLQRSKDISELLDEAMAGKNSFDSHTSSVLLINQKDSSSTLMKSFDSIITLGSQESIPHLFNTGNFTASMICNLIILLTYGVGYPPLSVVIGLSTVIEAFHMQYLLGRYWRQILCLDNQSTGAKGSAAIGSLQVRSVRSIQAFLVDVLENSFVDATIAIAQITMLILVIIGLFFSFFVFDMIGDSYEATGTFNPYSLIAVMVALFPVLLLSLRFLWHMFLGEKNQQTAACESEQGAARSAVQKPSHTGTTAASSEQHISIEPVDGVCTTDTPSYNTMRLSNRLSNRLSFPAVLRLTSRSTGASGPAEGLDASMNGIDLTVLGPLREVVGRDLEKPIDDFTEC